MSKRAARVREQCEENLLALVQSTVGKAMHDAGIYNAELARRLKFHRAAITLLMNGSCMFTVGTWARALNRCGYEVTDVTVTLLKRKERPMSRELRAKLEKFSNDLDAMRATMPRQALEAMDYFRRSLDDILAAAEDAPPAGTRVYFSPEAVWHDLFPEGTETGYEPVDFSRWLDAYTKEVEAYTERRLKLAAQPPQAPKEQTERPKIVCLCGSTRFTVEMAEKSWELAKQGVIALGWNILLSDPEQGSHGAEAEGVKEQIDELHKRKIDLADEVFVLNIGGYIGQSTRSEIDYALAHQKPVIYLESTPKEPGR